MSSWGENGSYLTRGEFNARAEQWTDKLDLIDQRLEHIEERLDRNKRMFLGALTTTLGRGLLIAVGAALTVIASKYGVSF